MRSYKRYTRRKRLLKQIAVVALVFILGFVLLRAVSYMAIQGEIPMINSFNLFRREADTSFGWNLILVNDDYCVPRNYEVELTELSNGEKVDSRIYPQLQQMFDDARAEGLELFVREGYRTTQDQKDIMNERIQQYQNEGYSRGEAKKLAKEYVAEPGTSEHELGIAVDINADTSKCSSDTTLMVPIMCMRTFHGIREARRKSTGISEKILRNIHSPIISEENLQILQACIWHSLQRFCWRF